VKIPNDLFLHQGGHNVKEKTPEFLRLFQSHNYTFPDVIVTIILAAFSI